MGMGMGIPVPMLGGGSGSPPTGIGGGPPGRGGGGPPIGRGGGAADMVDVNEWMNESINNYYHNEIRFVAALPCQKIVLVLVMM